MGNMRFKVGDRVRIKSLDWYNDNKNNKGVIVCGSESFTHPMSYFCNKVVNIITIQDDCYRILEDDGDWYWTDEMIEELVEDETYNFLKTDKPYPSSEDRLDNIQFVVYNELKLPDGYIFKDENGNVINATMIVLEKKKEYPKTYEECCEVLFPNSIALGKVLTSGYKCELLRSFGELLICRDAYWKIAGEQMGLGKDLPWVPDWMRIEPIYVILYQYHAICKAEVSGGTSCILAFPTEEMRDAFYENFKELIETVKELL